MTLAERAAAEVVSIHAHFVAMLTGRAGANALLDAMARMAADFTRVAPDATVQDRAAVEAMLVAMTGRVAADFAIAITIEDARELAPGVAVVRYREEQSAADRRRSTAVLVDTAAGLRWTALQETFIDAAPENDPGASSSRSGDPAGSESARSRGANRRS